MARCAVVGGTRLRRAPLELEPVIVFFAVREGMASVLDESGLPELHLGGLNEASSRVLLERTATSPVPKT